MVWKNANVKVKCTLVQALRLCTGRTAHRGSRGIALPFHDHYTRRGECSAARPGRFTPRKRPGTLCTGGWVGSRAGLDRCGKSRPPPGFDPRTVEPVASRHIDYTTGLTKDDNEWWGNYNLEGGGNGCFLYCDSVCLQIPMKITCLLADGDAILKLS